MKFSQQIVVIVSMSGRRRKSSLDRLIELIERYPVLGIVYSKEILAFAVSMSKAAEKAKKSKQAKKR